MSAPLEELDLVAEEEVRKALRGLQRALHDHVKDNQRHEDGDYVDTL